MINKNISISIIIPCYNHGQYIDDAIKSIEEYDKDDYELIIINDGSTDESTNKRLTVLKNEGYNVIFQKNQGLGRTRNNGIRLAKGKYILPLDADNKIKPEYIIKAVDILENNPSVSIVYSDRQLFGKKTNVMEVGVFNFPRILKTNYIDACAIFRKNVWEEIGGYDEKMPVQGWEDWDFWLSAVEKDFEFYYIAEPLFFYRVHDDSMIYLLNRNPNKTTLIKYFYEKHSLLAKDKFVDIIIELNNEIDNLQIELNTIRHSEAFMLGKFIIKPISLLRNLFHTN